MGSIYKRGAVYWIKYHRNGRPFYESSGSTAQKDAKNLLMLREGDIARGVPVTPQVTRCTIDELLADVVTDYEINKKKSLEALRHRLKHLLPHFGGWRAAAVTPADVRRYVAERQAANAANAQINRELAALKRAFTLGVEGGKILTRPKIAMLEEHNVRQGFFERDQFEAVRTRLPADIRPVVTFGYLTGWRILSEVLPLPWRQVDFTAGRVRLEPGTTKNKQGREFPLTAELRALLEAQRAHTDTIQRLQGKIIPTVFHRDGAPIRDFYGSWHSACRAAAVPGRIPHDFRRTAVRNLVRAGIPERVAMTMTGHKTRAVFENYNIVSPGDLDDAARRLDDLTVTKTVTVPPVERHGHRVTR
jgi:integrase